MVDHWAQITAQRRQFGREIACGDAWIGASAIRHGATLLTHNAGDFEGISGLEKVSHGV
jgi:predicted nucleic acid-binding protein